MPRSPSSTGAAYSDSMAPGTPAQVKIAALIYNPIKVDKSRLRALLETQSATQGWRTPLFFETTPEDLGQKITADALAAGADVILVAGGDGTVRAVSEAVAGTGVPLAILPSGTGNLLARNLNLPLGDPAPLIEAAFSGVDHPIDIGQARIRRPDGTLETHAFVVMAGIGLDAAMIANTNPALKKNVGWVAYVDGAARSLVNAEPFRAVYQLDQHRIHSARVQSILFANCGALPAGIALITDASLVDGELDVVVFQPAGWWGWLAVWRRVWWDNSVLHRSRAGREVLRRRRADSAVKYRRGASAEVAVGDPQPVELDGDEFGEATRIACSVEPGALLVRLPAGTVVV